MKKVKNKYIRLTETQLNNIIKECVHRELSLITEYAIKRKEFKYNIWCLLEQIIQNWCLIHICTLNNSDINQCKNHWKQELSSYLSKIARTEIKGNNSIESRIKTIMEVFVENDLNDPNIIKDYITDKFIKENISITNQLFDVVAENCSNALVNIAQAIANKTTREYIETI